MGLNLLTFLELPDFGNGVTFAIFHLFGTSYNSKDKLTHSIRALWKVNKIDIFLIEGGVGVM